METINSEEENEEDFFNFLADEQYEKIKKFLSNNKKTQKIWEYVNEESDNSSVLHIAVYRKNINITKEIIEYCKEKLGEKECSNFINKENKQGVTALHFASFKGDVKIIELLIINGAKIEIITKRNLNVIHYASQGNSPNSLMYFLTYYPQKISLMSKDLGGSTPLHWASFSAGEEILSYLLNEEEVDIDEKDNQGYTPLHLAVLSQSIKIILKLLQKGANTRIRDKKGQTPRDIAISKKYLKIAKILEESESCQFCAYKAPVKKIKKSRKYIFMVTSFQTITNLILIFLTFPDILCKIRDIPFYFFFVHLIMLIIFLTVYIKLIFSDPGIMKQKNKIEQLLNKNEDLRKYCPKCHVLMTKNSKHCAICEKCFEGFDHHCYWVNNCIGEKNYCLFLGFLFISLIYLLVILGIVIIWLFKDRISILIEDDCGLQKKNIFLKYYQENFKSLGVYPIFRNIGKILLPLMLAFFLIPVILLVILHMRVCCFNYRLEKKNKRAEALLSTVNTYSLISI